MRYRYCAVPETSCQYSLRRRLRLSSGCSLLLICDVRSRSLTTKLSDSRRRAPVERRGDFQITRDSQTESAAAVRCSALVRPRHRFLAPSINLPTPHPSNADSAPTPAAVANLAKLKPPVCGNV